jgi:hypothetical protein
MNPNSANQRWSKWTFTVTPGRTIERPFTVLKENCARFGRKAFGGATEMRITQTRERVTIEVRTEGHAQHEAPYVEWMRKQWERFLINGFGLGTTVTLETKIEAGSRQDGRPADQLIILPPLSVNP